MDASLYNWLISDEKMSESERVFLLQGIAHGLGHLHMENVVHRDLAARNILLKKTHDRWVPKIADFGLSRLLEQQVGAAQTQTDVGPLKIMAPECLMNREYSAKSDVWAFGVLIAEIYFRCEPYPELSAVQVAAAVARQELTHAIPEYAPEFIQEIMDYCFKYTTDERPTMQMIIKVIDTNAEDWIREEEFYDHLVLLDKGDEDDDATNMLPAPDTLSGQGELMDTTYAGMEGVSTLPEPTSLDMSVEVPKD